MRVDLCCVCAHTFKKDKDFSKSPRLRKWGGWGWKTIISPTEWLPSVGSGLCAGVCVCSGQIGVCKSTQPCAPSEYSKPIYFLFA